MENELVVKSNSLVEASYSLSVAEFRLLQMVFSEISKYDDSNGFMLNHEFRVHAKDYASVFGVDMNTAYEALHNATNRLFHRYFSYERIYAKPDKIEIVNSRWVQKVAYSREHGSISMQLTSDVIDMVGKLKNCFTKYKIKQISNLTSIYALRLYELIIQWSSIKKTPTFEISEFREKLGVTVGEYSRMFDFKKYVLDLAVKQINEHTDIQVTYEQHKNGRTIYGFSFSFVELQKIDKTKKEKNTFTIDNIATIAKGMRIKPETKKRKVITEYEATQMARVGETWENLLLRIKDDYFVKFGKKE